MKEIKFKMNDRVRLIKLPNKKAWKGWTHFHLKMNHEGSVLHVINDNKTLSVNFDGGHLACVKMEDVEIIEDQS